MGTVLVHIGIRILEAIFAFGIVGSTIVVIVAGIEDVAEVFRSDKPEREGME